MKGKTVILGKRQKIEVADDSAFFLWEPQVHIGKDIFTTYLYVINLYIVIFKYEYYLLFIDDSQEKWNKNSIMYKCSVSFCA